MHYQRTYLDKCATIVKGSEYNTGLNPISDLVWGKNVSRFLIHFDHNKIKGMVEDKTFGDINKLKHILRITNAGSLDESELHKVYCSQIDASTKKRATSFDLIFFLIPESWDCGKGFDYTKNYFNNTFYNDKKYKSSLYKLTDGVNWFQSKNGDNWKDSIPFMKTENGLFDFYVKSDKLYVSHLGGKVVLTYYGVCNNSYVTSKLELEEINKSNNELTISKPICFTKNGQICHTDIQKQKYGAYIQVAIDIPSTTVKKLKKHSFRLKYEVDGVEYKSNPYTIKQLGTTEQFYPQPNEGIYSSETLENELEKYERGEESIVIGKQHFDIGNENIELDITKVFNKFITGELNNYGIGIAYSPIIENSESLIENYTGFITNKTNSFFEPFVETINEEVIRDDRNNFILGKTNRLYLYSNIGGCLENLDKMPKCSIDGEEYEVKQATKGIYYVEINLPISAYTASTMLYDRWTGLVYQGQEIKPVEMEFVTKSPLSYFRLGTALPEKNEFTPIVYGISHNETIKRGDIRKLCVEVRKNYTKTDASSINGIEMRMYIMDGTAQVDIFPYTEVNKAFIENYLLIDTNILIPEVYYVDVKVKYGMESIEHHDVLKFRIVDDANNQYS